MRLAFPEPRLDCLPIGEVEVNLDCRDEIIPILRALQHLYGHGELRCELVALVAKDVNGSTDSRLGRRGMNYWEIAVLAAARLGCNLDYDKLQDLAENHRRWRHIMGLGDWQEQVDFDWRRIEDNVIKLQPDTLRKISELIVKAGHKLQPQAIETVRGDTFLVETNIHYPTESTVIGDGLRKIVRRSAEHTELIKRGKQPNPIQFGHHVLLIEDAAGFVVDYRVVAHGVQDQDLVVPVMKDLQERFAGKIKSASFDRGFHRPDNQTKLAEIVKTPCLAAKGQEKGRQQQKEGTVAFRQARQNHPGVESAIGALQAGNGLKRCRDRSKLGYERYVALGVLGRNLQTLGKQLLAQDKANCAAAKSKRKKAAG